MPARYTPLLIAPFLLCIFSEVANASLIGDTVIVREASDTGSGLNYSPFFVEIGPIASDDSDETAIYNDPGAPTLNFSESSFVMEFYNVAQSFSGNAPIVFNGYEISSIDFLPGYKISGVSVQQNLVNWDGNEPVNFFDGTPLLFTSDRISFTNDTIYLDFQGLSYRVTGDLLFDITFTSVPAPAALWLFISGFIALLAQGIKNARS